MHSYSKTGAPILVIPSLINRARILDLSREKSLMRWLAGQGLKPYLLDWGEPAPGSEERFFSLSDYVQRLLLPAAQFVAAADGPPALLGYCMGGTLSVALAMLEPQLIRGLALLAAPWDFHADDGKMSLRAQLYAHAFSPWLACGTPLPADAIQGMFTGLQPLEVLNKFRLFGSLARIDGAKAKNFILIEDWLNDGVALAAPAARECLTEWYGENRPGNGKWQIAGQTVDPGLIDLPALALLPSRDRIVPPLSAAALAGRLPKVQSLKLERLGHVGMIISRRAPDAVWRPLAQWLKNLNPQLSARKVGSGKISRQKNAKSSRRTIASKRNIGHG